MTTRTYEQTPYLHFEIFLWQSARVLESAGTMTSGPVLFVTLNSSGNVSIGADDTTDGQRSDSQVYRDGAELRGRLAAITPDDIEAGPPLRVIEPRAARKALRRPSRNTSTPSRTRTVRMASKGTMIYDSFGRHAPLYS